MHYCGDMENKQLAGLSRYNFRSDGEVVSMWSMEEKVLGGGVDKDGYRKFVLIDDVGSRRSVRRSSLICAAYHGPRPRGKEVRHLDGSRDNDAPSNLAWATHAENCADKIDHGTAQRGKKNGNVRLTEAQARVAKDRLLLGETAPKIARDYGVSRATIYNIKYGTTWGWLDDK